MEQFTTTTERRHLLQWTPPCFSDPSWLRAQSAREDELAASSHSLAAKAEHDGLMDMLEFWLASAAKHAQRSAEYLAEAGAIEYRDYAPGF